MLTYLLGNNGDSLDWVAEQAAARGQAPPDIVKNRPELRRALEFYWSAFNELSTDCDHAGRIRWTAIDTYARRYDVQFEAFRYIIREMEKARREASK